MVAVGRVSKPVSISPDRKEIPRAEEVQWLTRGCTAWEPTLPWGATASPYCVSLHTGEFHDPVDNPRRVQLALASPFPSAWPPLGFVSDAGSCLELLPPPGLPNLPSLFHQHPVFTWLQNPHTGGRKRREGSLFPFRCGPRELC